MPKIILKISAILIVSSIITLAAYPAMAVTGAVGLCLGVVGGVTSAIDLLKDPTPNRRPHRRSRVSPQQQEIGEQPTQNQQSCNVENQSQNNRPQLNNFQDSSIPSSSVQVNVSSSQLISAPSSGSKSNYPTS